MKNSFLVLVIAVLFSFIATSPALAQTWAGGTSTDWNTAGNWSPASVPTSSSIATFSGTTNTSVTLSGAATAAGILFTGTPGAFTIGTSGDAGITLGNFSSISMNSTVANSESVGSNLTINTSYIFSNNSTTTSAALDIGAPGGTITIAGGQTLSLAGSNTGTNTIYSDISGDLSSGLFLNKSGSGTWILAGDNAFGTQQGFYSSVFSVSGGVLDITGQTSVAAASGNPSIGITGGILDVSGANGQLTGGVPIQLSGGELLLDDRGAGNESSTRLSTGSSLTFNNGGSFVYEGTDEAGNNSGQTVGPITLGSGTSVITISYNGTNSAKVTTSAINRSTSTSFSTVGGIALVNGVNLGATTFGSGSVGQLVLSGGATPTLIGTTAGGANGMGINTGVDNTRIVPYLLGESGTATGENGTATGTANTFLTYDTTSSSSNGFRPLNPTDEFMNNAIVSGDNTYITTATTATSSTSINSLVINGGDLSINDGVILNNASGAILFVTSNAIKPTGTTGALNFGGSEGVISANAGVNAVISTAITGSNGVTIYGPGTVTLSGSNSYSGSTAVSTGATLEVGSNSALGTSTIYASGGTIRADNQARSLQNTLVANGSNYTIGGSNDLTFAGDSTSHVAFTDNTFQNNFLYYSNTGTTTFSGIFSLNNSNTGSNNSGSFVNLGSSANVVVTGPIQDNNAGNNATGNQNGLTVTYSGANANFTIDPTAANNNFGQGLATSFTVNVNGSDVATYDTLTIGGPTGGPITPFGAGGYATNTTGVFLVAASNGEIVSNNFSFGGSVHAGNFAYGLGFAGTNSLTLSGNFDSPFVFANIAANTATLTFSGTVASGFTLLGSGNTAFSSTSSQTGGSFIKSGAGLLTLSGTNNMTGSTTFNGGTTVLDYSTNNNNKLAQSSTPSASALVLGGVNLQLSGGSYAQGLGTGNGITLAAGKSTITQTNSSTATIALGAISRSNGSAIDFGTGVATTTTSNTNGIIGGYATVNGANWAVSNGGSTAISALSSYDSFATPGTNANILQTDSGSVTASGTVNSLKITDTIAAQSLAVGSGQTLTLSSGGVLFIGANDYTISGGSLGSSTTDLIINQNGNGVLTISSNLNNAITKNGAGTLVLTGNTTPGFNNVYLNQGIVSVSSESNLGGNNLNFNGGTLEVTGGGFTYTGFHALNFLANGGTFQVDSGTLTIDNTMSLSGTSSGGLTKTGAGTLIMADMGGGFTGAVTVDAGTLQLGSSNALGSSSTGSNRSLAPVLVNGGTLDIDGQTTALGNVTLESGAINDTAGTGTLSAYSFTLESGSVGAVLSDVILNGNTGSNSIDLYKTTAGTVILTGANTYSGATQISGGTLQVGDGGMTGQLGTANVTMSNGSTLAFDRSNAYAVNNAITGSGGVTQMGSGTTTLTNSNSYTGVTAITGGTLKLSSSISNNNIGSSSEILVGDTAAHSSATLDVTGITATGGFQVQSGQTLAGHGTVLGNTTFLSGSVLSPGNSPGTTTYNGNLVLNAGTKLVFDLAAIGLSDEAVVTGDGSMLTLNNQGISDFTFNLLSGVQSGTYTLIDSSLNGINGSLDTTPGSLTELQDGYSLTLSTGGGDVLLNVAAAVPEPSTWAMLLGSLALLMFVQYKRRRS